MEIPPEVLILLAVVALIALFMGIMPALLVLVVGGIFVAFGL